MDVCAICAKPEPEVEIIERNLHPDPPFYPAEPWAVCRDCDKWLRNG